MRHRVKGKKLGRTASHRKALLRNLSKSLIKNGFLVTTESKAKYLRPFLEKLIESGKKGDLAARRRLISLLGSKNAASELITKVAPEFKKKSGGYLRVIKMYKRSGDKALKVKVEWALGKKKEKL